MVVIGGGTGSFNILSGLRSIPVVNLQSIVTMMDSGGDSGVLRDAYGVLPPGDLRRCLVALSEESELLRDLFSFRFTESPLTGRNFGNLFILALTRALGSEQRAVNAMGKILKIRGRVLPVTWEHSHLVAELENNELIHGEANIDGRGGSDSLLPPHDPNIPIRRVYLEPPAKANPEAVDAILKADFIVIAPGDVFSSIVPNLLVAGIPEAIQNASAPLICILNLMTKHGETDGWSASRHVSEIAKFAGRLPNTLLIHKGSVPRGPLARYDAESAQLVEIDREPLERLGLKIHSADIASTRSLVRHDPTRTGTALLHLFGIEGDQIPPGITPQASHASQTQVAVAPKNILESGRLPGPLSQATAIVSKTARQFDADISTLFVIEGRKLVLKGGVSSRRGKELLPTGYEYPMYWDAEPNRRHGLTHLVAITGQSLHLASYAELMAQPAHLGKWDPDVYPDGVDDATSGFGCLYAVPLRLSSIASARDSAIGVFKIERRRKGAHGIDYAPFSHTERAAFDCVAEHLSTILRSHGEPQRAANMSGESQLGRVAESFFPILNVSVDPIAPPQEIDDLDAMRRDGRGGEVERLLGAVACGFEGLGVEPGDREAAIRNLRRWLVDDVFALYRLQLEWLVQRKRWPLLLDSFYRVLPFGTGGRRGPVGIGPNRFNEITLASSVQGHADYIRELYPDENLSVVVVYDVRCFYDLGQCYNSDLPNPLLEMSSKAFASIAAGVYVANQVHVHMLPKDSRDYISTPELSYTIRELGAHAGLNISASHNPPDDNGGKFYNRFGAQHVPPGDEVMAKRVENVAWLRRLGLDDAIAAGRISEIPPDIHQKYIDMNVQQSLTPEARSAHVVFSPLHGTGNTTVAAVLQRAGFKLDVVQEQSTMDGRFPAVPFRAPNPEVPESMQAGIDLANELGADLVMACDPDADRIGLCARSRKGDFVFVNGNEISVLVAYYKLFQLKQLGRLPTHPIIIKTEVTTELLRLITEDFGGTLFGNLLVGFKYHGNILERIECDEEYGGVKAKLEDFVVGVEESHGVLTTSDVRDKDAAGAAILLAELASHLKESRQTLMDYLDGIYRRYGYHANLLSSMVMTGAEGLRSIQKIQNTLRAEPPQTIGRWKVVKMVNHRDKHGIHGPWLSGTDWASRDVLGFQLENGARLLIRPSGTEPKNKIYIEVPRPALGERSEDETLSVEKDVAQAIAQEISDDFSCKMLAIIGSELPAYALRISGLVSLDNRLDFTNAFVPEFELHAQRVVERVASQADISAWVDERLAGYGKDARGLVRAAFEAFLSSERAGAAFSTDRVARLHAMESIFSDSKKSVRHVIDPGELWPLADSSDRSLC